MPGRAGSRGGAARLQAATKSASEAFSRFRNPRGLVTSPFGRHHEFSTTAANVAAPTIATADNVTASLSAGPAA